MPLDLWAGAVQGGDSSFDFLDDPAHIYRHGTPQA